MQEWIKTEDRLPDRVDDYIVAMAIKYKHKNEIENVVDLATFFSRAGILTSIGTRLMIGTKASSTSRLPTGWNCPIILIRNKA